MYNFAIVNINSGELVGYRRGMNDEHAVNMFVDAFPKFRNESKWLAGYPEREWAETQLALTRQRLADYDEECRLQDRMIRYI